MKYILALMDYKSVFGSKKFNFPYRSGMDKEKLRYFFKELGYVLEYKFFNEIDFSSKEYIGRPVIYTSSEDVDYLYKSYIEDIIYGLEQMGANVMPSYNHLRANNNKVFMEFLREYMGYTTNLKSRSFGSMNDLQMHIDSLKFPAVFKTSEGAVGKGVRLVESAEDLIRQVKKTTKRNYKMDLWDFI